MTNENEPQGPGGPAANDDSVFGLVPNTDTGRSPDDLVPGDDDYHDGLGDAALRDGDQSSGDQPDGDQPDEEGTETPSTSSEQPPTLLHRFPPPTSDSAGQSESPQESNFKQPPYDGDSADTQSGSDQTETSQAQTVGAAGSGNEWLESLRSEEKTMTPRSDFKAELRDRLLAEWDNTGSVAPRADSNSNGGLLAPPMDSPIANTPAPGPALVHSIGAESEGNTHRRRGERAAGGARRFNREQDWGRYAVAASVAALLVGTVMILSTGDGADERILESASTSTIERQAAQSVESPASTDVASSSTVGPRSAIATDADVAVEVDDGGGASPDDPTTTTVSPSPEPTSAPDVPNSNPPSEPQSPGANTEGVTESDTTDKPTAVGDPPQGDPPAAMTDTPGEYEGPKFFDRWPAGVVTGGPDGALLQAPPTTTSLTGDDVPPPPTVDVSNGVQHFLPEAAVPGAQTTFEAGGDQDGERPIFERGPNFLQTFDVDDGLFVVNSSLYDTPVDPERGGTIDTTDWVNDWPSAYYLTAPKGALRAELKSSGGVVYLSSVGLDRATFERIASSMTRIGTGVAGWTVNADGVNDNFLAGLGSDRALWTGADLEPLAQLEMSDSAANRFPWIPANAEVVPVEINGTIGAASSIDGVVSVSWFERGGQGIKVSYRGSWEEALSFARTVHPVSNDDWLAGIDEVDNLSGHMLDVCDLWLNCDFQ